MQWQNNMNIKSLLTNSMLAAIALIIFTLESLIPPLIPIQGIKLGLANIVVVFALYAYGRKDAVFVLIARVLLASLFAGQLTSVLYSISGGLLAVVSMCLIKKVLSEEYMQYTSIIGAIFHNIGQILMAIVITGTIQIALYLPILIAVSLVTGLFTGLVCKYLYNRLIKLNLLNKGS